MTLRVINPRQIEAKVEGGLTGRHVLAIFIGFFGVIFAVNGYMLYSAISTNTGIVANEPYRKGLAYNQRIAAAERQAGLGWTDAVEVGSDGRVGLSLARPDGTPLRGLLIEGSIGRPSTDRQDHVLRFTEHDGRYVADAGALADGAWLLTIAAHEAPEAAPVFRSRRRIWLKP